MHPRSLSPFVWLQNGRHDHPFVCIEGVDGVGKTTIALKLAAKLGAVYYKTPSPPFDLIRSQIDSAADPRTRFLYYLSSVAHASSEILQLLDRSPVVCDRYIYSTVAYHVCMEDTLRRWLPVGVFLKPDLSVLLTADQPTRIARLAARGPNGFDAQVESNHEFLAKVQDEFLKFDFCLVDTSRVSIDEVVAKVVARLTEMEVH